MYAILMALLSSAAYSSQAFGFITPSARTAAYRNKDLRLSSSRHRHRPFFERRQAVGVTTTALADSFVADQNHNEEQQQQAPETASLLHHANAYLETSTEHDYSYLHPLLESIENIQLGAGCDQDDAKRIFHGRGGVFPGCEHITLDLFSPVWLLTSYNLQLDDTTLMIVQQTIERKYANANATSIFQNNNNVNSDKDIEHNNNSNNGSDSLQDDGDDDDSCCNILYQFRSPTNATTQVLRGTVPNPHVITENGMKFLVRLDIAKNHGIFLDMANGRKWIRQRSENAVVLNLFSYTCGFSVAALLGGAETVVNMDMAKGALKTGQRNHELNGVGGSGGTDAGTARFLAHDIFKSWGKIKKLGAQQSANNEHGGYDFIVVDPPSFQKSSFVAKKDYGKIIRRLPDLLSRNDDHDHQGQVLLCLNAPELDTKWLQDIVSEEAPELIFVERLENPSSFACADPERGLKVLVYRLGGEC